MSFGSNAGVGAGLKMVSIAFFFIVWLFVRKKTAQNSSSFSQPIGPSVSWNKYLVCLLYCV